MLQVDNSTPAEVPESAMRWMLMRSSHPLLDHPGQCSMDITRRAEVTVFTVAGELDLDKYLVVQTRTARLLRMTTSAVVSKAQQMFSDDLRETAGPMENGFVLIPEMASP